MFKVHKFQWNLLIMQYWGRTTKTRIQDFADQHYLDIQEEYDNSILEQAKSFEAFEKLNDQNLDKWLQSDAYDFGFHYSTDEDIVTVLMRFIVLMQKF